MAVLSAFFVLTPATGRAATHTVEIPNGQYTAGNSEYACGNSNDGGRTCTYPNNNDNELNIKSNGTVRGAFGARVSGNGFQSATGNTVNVEGTADSSVSGADVESLDNSARASDNFVNVKTGGRVKGIYGGYAKTSGSGQSVEANSNTVTLDGTTENSTESLIAGGMVRGAGDGSSTGTVMSNIVIINEGASVDDNTGIFGGVASRTSNTTVSQNTVTLKGGTITANIYGGALAGGSGTIVANDNIVTIEGAPTLTGSLYGGATIGGTATGDLFTGNTLNLKTSAPLTVNGVFNFENLNFYLPSTLAANETVLTVNGTANLTNGTQDTTQPGSTSSIVNVGIEGTASQLEVGDTVTLIQATTLSRYFGAHLGVGKKYALTSSLRIEPQAQFLWTHQQADSARLSLVTPATGERLPDGRLEFEPIDSKRLRLGIKLEGDLSETLAGFAGWTLEREFDAKARATVNGLSTGGSSLEGTSRVIELGFTMKPSVSSPLSVDVGVQRHTGKREGVTGSVNVRYAF